MIIFRLSENNILKSYPQHHGVNECLFVMSVPLHYCVDTQFVTVHTGTSGGHTDIYRYTFDRKDF